MNEVPIQFGPYSSYESEQVVEEILDSKEHYHSLTQLLRGDIENNDFLSSLQFLTESIHASMLERERENWRYE